jgi:acyl-CoA thioesterase FadM
VFDHATEAFHASIGVDDAYRRSGASTFAVEQHIVYARELKAGAPLRVAVRLAGFDDKRLFLFLEMHHAGEGYLAATCELLCLHVDFTARKASPFPPALNARLTATLAAHRAVPLTHTLSRRCLLDRQDLSGIDLTGANLRDASFARADLSKAKLADIGGYNVKFLSTNLQSAVLDHAKLEGADFTKADLTGASLKDTDLRRASLFRATLKNANLSGAQMREADLSFADFTGATWTDGKTVCAEGSVGKCR